MEFLFKQQIPEMQKLFRDVIPINYAWSSYKEVGITGTGVSIFCCRWIDKNFARARTFGVNAIGVHSTNTCFFTCVQSNPVLAKSRGNEIRYSRVSRHYRFILILCFWPDFSRREVPILRWNELHYIQKGYMSSSAPLGRPTFFLKSR